MSPPVRHLVAALACALVVASTASGITSRPPTTLLAVGEHLNYTRAAEALREYLAKARVELMGNISTDFVFLNPQGTKLTRQAVWLMTRQYAKTAGIEGVPCFILGGLYAVSGAQDPDKLARAIRQISAEINAEAAE